MPGASIDNSISHQTKMTIGLVIVLLGGGGAFLYRDMAKEREAMRVQQEHRDRMAQMEHAINEIKRTLEEGIGDRWTLTSQSEHALRMKLANPAMNVPDPRRPGTYIHSSGGGAP